MKINIIGGGPAALMAAEQLARENEVHLYEKGKAIGRKFLVAGKGGFNLSNEASGAALKNKYLPAGFLNPALDLFDTLATRDWLHDLGIPTFIGSSGRLFPEKGIKPIEVLQKWKQRLEDFGVQFYLEHEFVGFTENGEVKIVSKEKEMILAPDATVFALGGASWSVTGSSGDWLGHFQKLGIEVRPFAASNCGLLVDWPPQIQTAHLGKPLKNCTFSLAGNRQTGEVVIADYGMEGNGIYALVPAVRQALEEQRIPLLEIDLKPQNSSQQLVQKLGNKAPRNFASALNLNALQMALVKNFTSKADFLVAEKFASAIKKIQIPVQGLRPVEEAISTVGGIALEAINSDFSLKKFPKIYVIGEMLDWDAPTGGFLLQACFSMGFAVAKEIK